jgi:hypothetical protein
VDHLLTVAGPSKTETKRFFFGPTRKRSFFLSKIFLSSEELFQRHKTKAARPARNGDSDDVICQHVRLLDPLKLFCGGLENGTHCFDVEPI